MWAGNIFNNAPWPHGDEEKRVQGKLNNNIVQELSSNTPFSINNEDLKDVFLRNENSYLGGDYGNMEFEKKEPCLRFVNERLHESCAIDGALGQRKAGSTSAMVDGCNLNEKRSSRGKYGIFERSRKEIDNGAEYH